MPTGKSVTRRKRPTDGRVTDFRPCLDWISYYAEIVRGIESVARLLLQRLANPQANVPGVLLPHRLVIRGSA
jgi:hypothetical protein